MWARSYCGPVQPDSLAASRVQRGHVRRPGHSPQRTVSDDRRRGKHDEDCSDSNRDGGLGLRRGCDRRMRSSSLARSRDVPCSGRRKRHIRISETSAQISTRICTKTLLLGGGPSAWGCFIPSRFPFPISYSTYNPAFPLPFPFPFPISYSTYNPHLPVCTCPFHEPPLPDPGFMDRPTVLRT